MADGVKNTASQSNITDLMSRNDLEKTMKIQMQFKIQAKDPKQGKTRHKHKVIQKVDSSKKTKELCDKKV